VIPRVCLQLPESTPSSEQLSKLPQSHEGQLCPALLTAPSTCLSNYAFAPGLPAGNAPCPRKLGMQSLPHCKIEIHTHEFSHCGFILTKNIIFSCTCFAERASSGWPREILETCWCWCGQAISPARPPPRPPLILR
jgi:hypothetical protein